MTYETEIREHAKELGYRLIKVPGTDRYNLAENHWYGWDLNKIEEKLEEIEREMYGDEDEQSSDPPVAPPGPLAVTPAPVVAPDSGDLDAEIAELTEKIRQILWRYAAGEWWCHYVEDETPVYADEDWICPAMAYAWQRAIDLGYAQPVTVDPGLDYPVPDREWIGVGLDDSRYEAWEGLWEYVEMMISLDEIRRLARRWVEREAHRAILPENLDELISDLFDEDGDWKSEDQRAFLPLKHLGNSIPCGVRIPRPTFFTDDLITKVDRQGAPDYASGWWDEDDEDPADFED